ncbi:MAG TPA: hypothetical protein VFX85_12875 [Solirubrobacterales bacterium]|nr:hypothetical protein [Solirubrobacterales bacterium]
MRFRVLTLTLALLGLAAAPALAKDGDIERAGTCSGATSAELKLSEENGRIEVEFEVDQNRNGVRWQVVLKRNGTKFATASRTTGGASGSFELRRVISGGAGTKVTARAVSPSGETCSASATFA